MSESENWTIGRLLEWTTGYLREHGSDTARLDAELLLAEACGCQRIDLYTRFAELPSDERRTAFRGLVRRRAEGMPVAYLLGRREFYSLSFHVTPDVLIPRPETEFVVICLLDLARPRGLDQPYQVADVGTGSGILAICAARELGQARVTAVDKSGAALAVAGENAAAHGVAERIEFFESNLFAAVPPERRFDFVLSNPPYLSTAEMQSLAPDVVNYEPRLALDAGPRGTEVIERLVPQSAERLLPGGYLLMEISPTIEKEVIDIVRASGQFEAPGVTKDLAGQPRVVQARRTA